MPSAEALVPLQTRQTAWNRAMISFKDNRDDTDDTQPPLPPEDATEAPQTSPPVTVAPQPVPTSPPITAAPQPVPTSPPPPPVTEAPVTSATSPPTDGTCTCTNICQQCELQGVDDALCQEACAIATQPDCVQRCSDFIQGTGNRGDVGTQPPLPPDDGPIIETLPPVPDTGTCYCKEICNPSCGTAPCKSVCDSCRFIKRGMYTKVQGAPSSSLKVEARGHVIPSFSDNEQPAAWHIFS